MGLWPFVLLQAYLLCIYNTSTMCLDYHIWVENKGYRLFGLRTQKASLQVDAYMYIVLCVSVCCAVVVGDLCVSVWRGSIVGLECD